MRGLGKALALGGVRRSPWISRSRPPWRRMPPGAPARSSRAWPTAPPSTRPVRPAPGGTENDPLVIDPKGSVAWQGSTDVAITSGRWAWRSAECPS